MLGCKCRRSMYGRHLRLTSGSYRQAQRCKQTSSVLDSVHPSTCILSVAAGGTHVAPSGNNAFEVGAVGYLLLFARALNRRDDKGCRQNSAWPRVLVQDILAVSAAAPGAGPWEPQLPADHRGVGVGEAHQPAHRAPFAAVLLHHDVARLVACPSNQAYLPCVDRTAGSVKNCLADWRRGQLDRAVSHIDFIVTTAKLHSRQVFKCHSLNASLIEQRDRECICSVHLIVYR